MSNAESDFLRQMVGDWRYAFAMTDGTYSATGTEKVWSIGDWIAAENRGEGSDGETMHSLTVLGFNPDTGRFGGSFAGTMTAHLFVYDGVLGEDGATLPLETEGPAIAEGKASDRYRDVLTTIDADHRDIISQVLEADGTWREFMRWRFERAG